MTQVPRSLRNVEDRITLIVGPGVRTAREKDV